MLVLYVSPKGKRGGRYACVGRGFEGRLGRGPDLAQSWARVRVAVDRKVAVLTFFVIADWRSCGIKGVQARGGGGGRPRGGAYFFTQGPRAKFRRRTRKTAVQKGPGDWQMGNTAAEAETAAAAAAAAGGVAEDGPEEG